MLRRVMMAGQSAVPNEDTFDTDTRSLYTMTQNSGTPTAAIAGGILTLTCPPSCQASFTRNGTSITDGWAEVVVSQARDSGILFRFQDQSNYYLLALSDDSGASPSANLTLYRRVAGTFTSMGTYNAAWTRGITHTARLAVYGTNLKAYWDGAEVINATSNHITAAGKVGMRGHSPPGVTNSDNQFHTFRWL